MLKGRGRDPRVSSPGTPQFARLAPGTPQFPRQASPGTPQFRQTPSTPQMTRQAAPAPRAPLAKPEPDYEVVEFPTEEYVNAKLQPPPTPPRPPTGHPVDAGASCGLCGGGGARVRCAECGRRALCASCDDMYHRHPKRRNHQRQALSPTQLREEQRPPLPPKSNAPVPPPRRHKISGDRSSASPRPPVQEQRRATLGSINTMPSHNQIPARPLSNHGSPQAIPPHLSKMLPPAPPTQLGSMPYLPTNQHQAAAPVAPQPMPYPNNTMGHAPQTWGRPRATMPSYNMPPNMVQQPVMPETWEGAETMVPQAQTWGRPLRRGASVLELGGGPPPCPGCAHCAGTPWRYGSCASLDHGPWGWQPPCCPPQHHLHPHPHMHSSMTPQPYRRAESRAMSRAASRAGSRAASPAMSVRSRTSRRTKHRTPSPPPLPSSDADSESEESDHRHPPKSTLSPVRKTTNPPEERRDEPEDDSLGPAPPPPDASWQCEHCTFVNEPGVRVCVVCCRTPTTAPKVVPATNGAADAMARLDISEKNSARSDHARQKQNGEVSKVQPKKEKSSTGCGPSPPREDHTRKSMSRLVTPVRDVNENGTSRRHDMAVGPSPPKEIRYNGGKAPQPPVRHSVSVGPSPPREERQASVARTPPEPPTRHTISVGPSPPRERDLRPSTPMNQKKSVGASPPRGSVESRFSRSNVSNTGTSPPPQSISTQTYEVPTTWEREREKERERERERERELERERERDLERERERERERDLERERERAPSAPRSRSRRRFRDDARRERSHSRHSLSSDTRESERSVRTSGGRWEWREDGRSPRDSSPGAADWSSGERRRSARLTRRASHLDLRRARPVRRSSFYGEEVRDVSSPGAADWSSGERRRSARLTRRASHLDLRRARPVRRSSFYGEEVRDVSSPGAADWSSGERRRSARLTRRASHLDLRRARPVRRSSFYGEEVRDVSSPGAADWSSGERRRSARLTRRASHLDLRRARPVRRSSFYGEEVRDVSSPGAADWSSGERRRSARLTRRASHLDLRRARPVRRSSFYGEEVRDVSSPGAADWSSGERRRSARLTRRASHLDLRRARPVRRSSFYGEEVRDVSSPGAADWSSGERRRSARLTRRASHLDLRRARPVRRSSFYGEEVRDVSSPGAADWSSGERRRSARLTRRASHLDLRRARPVRRSSFYGEEVRDVSSPGAADWSSGERRRSARLTRRASHLDLRRARPVRRSSFYGEEVRDVSSPGAADWSSGERRRSARLTRRASHLDLRRARPVRRSSFYGEEAASPEPLPHNRAVSMEALAGAGGGGGAAREAERGLELARLMDAAERGGFSAAEVQAALAQSPAAPLAWLRSRWPSLVAGVQAAAARLAPGAVVTELEARAALARHRAAMWPAVTECVERHRRQEEGSVGEERRVRGRVWGSPVGLDDDAAPPPLAIKTTRRHHADDSSDEFEEPIPKTFQDDDWMYLPLPTQNPSPYDIDLNADIWGFPVNHKIEDLGQSFEPISTGIQLNIEEKPKITQDNPAPVQDKVEVVDTEEIAQKLKALLIQAGIPSINENLLLKGLLADNNNLEQNNTTDETIQNKTEKPDITIASNSEQTLDLGQSENDFINAYNALTRNSPLPNVNSDNTENVQLNNTELHNSGDRNVNLTSSIGATNNTVLQLNQNSDTSSASKYENIIETPLPTNDQALYNKTNAGGLIAVERPVEPINIIEEDNIPTISKEKTEVINIDLGTAHSNNEANINTDRNSPKQSGKQINKSPTENKPSAATKSSINIAESDTVVKDNDKSNNLNDIVDNTQKLIQQMKAEINSDINSLDDSNASHSEADNSSNESDLSTDHESLYTESEEDTDDLTTEDKDYTSSEDEEEQNTEKNTPGLARTSSEENEQFEEAMDHIEAQTGAIQKTNFEMLDSIARSLQEDHTVSLQLESKSKINRPKRQDVNNNFATVNSFEEIYEELNIDEPVKPEAPRVKNEVESIVVPKIEKLPYIKQEMDMLVFIPEPASVMMITEILLPVRNAIIEEPLPYIDESLESQDDLVDSETTVELNIKEPADEDNNDNAIQFNHILEDIVNDAPISDRLNSNKEGSPVATINTNVNNIEIATAVSALIEQNTDTSAISNQNENHIQNPKLPVSEIINTDSNKETQINNNGDNNSSRIESSNANQPIIQAQAESRSSKSPDKKSSSPSKDGRSSSSEKTTTKSNIPKLVKVLPSIKQKVEKIAPKVLASKVPVRRASIKQHPAPEPPKAHFGNIRSGHVKQLQTRLFDSKPGKPPAPATTIEIKPSTSTLNKKKPAPQPPTKQNSKQPSPPKTPSAQEKKEQYFRETCRTEDEWTESDSEDSQVQIVIKPEPEPVRSAPSPPPPLTLRRVSGQLIDLAHVRLPEGSPERQARMLLAEGAAESWEQAQLAVELVSRGAEPPAALLAALECADLCAALAYLHQDCELCAERLPEHEMVSMLRCTHRCCRECARLYFTVQVTERSIVDCVCPYCKEPELEALEEDAWLEYFAHLDILLKVLLDTDVHELFQRKLRDRTLARDPNFRWCVECSSGFFVHPKQKKVRCPECRSISCATCRKPWSASHEGLTCEQFAAWLEDNDPERSAAAVQQHLRENGLECPRCHFKYSLSRGGCMHFTCTQCKYEFCYGCGKPFTMGARCGLSEYCARLGLHAHHPRNCLFYLRDKEPHELQTLLQMNNVSFEIESPSPSGAAAARCPVQLQRETPTGLVDCACNADAPPKHAGLCKVHYVEYLAALCRPLDPIPIMDVPELVAELRRRALPLPERGPWDTDPIYAGMCAEIVKEKIPLD